MNECFTERMGGREREVRKKRALDSFLKESLNERIRKRERIKEKSLNKKRKNNKNDGDDSGFPIYTRQSAGRKKNEKKHKKNAENSERKCAQECEK